MSISTNYQEISIGQTILMDVVGLQKDIIVGSFTYRSILYQGALLATENRKYPCGVTGPEDIYSGNDEIENQPTSLFSCNQRFTYQNGDKTNLGSSDAFSLKTKKTTRLGVRLRPRQVLCSKCKSVCTDNSQKVSRAPKQTSQSSQSLAEELLKNDKTVLIPKLVKLSPNDIARATGSIYSNSIESSQPNDNKENRESSNSHLASHSLEDSVPKESQKKQKRQHKSKNKRKLVNTESHLDFDNANKNQSQQSPDVEVSSPCEKLKIDLKRSRVDIIPANQTVNVTIKSPSQPHSIPKKQASDETDPEQKSLPVLKISYGPEGRGVVMKINSRNSSTSRENCENEYWADSNLPKGAKKWKKQWKRCEDLDPLIQTHSSAASPNKCISPLRGGPSSPGKLINCSPRRSVPLSPLYPKVSSPACNRNFNMPMELPSIPKFTVPENVLPMCLSSDSRDCIPKIRLKKHKHKLKHKRKHKEDKHTKKSEAPSTSEPQQPADLLVSSEEPPRQKLSISLRRLSNENYVAYGSSSGLKNVSEELNQCSVDENLGMSSSSKIQENRNNLVEFKPQQHLNEKFSEGSVVWAQMKNLWWPAKIISINRYPGDSYASIEWFSLNRCQFVDQNSILSFGKSYDKCYLSDADDVYQQAVLEAIDEAERFEGSELIPELTNQTIPESPSQINVC